VAVINFTLNGRAQRIDVANEMPLLWVLRDTLNLTGTKFGCGVAMCGACTVHIDGQPARSCATQASAIAGKTAGDVATGEVLLAGPDERLPDVAQRMLDHGTSHAVVVEPRTGRPVGVLSTLDIAGILGWGLG